MRTDVTHRLLIEECRRVGITPPAARSDAVRSVTAAANRLISYRLDRHAHPFAGDGRASLARLGIRSAWARTDLALPRRLAYAGWFVAAAAVPRPLVRRVARPYLAVGQE